MTEQGAKRSNSLVKLLACFRLCRLESITARCVKRVECFAGTSGTCLSFGVHFCASCQLPLALPGVKMGGGEAGVLREDTRLVGLVVATGNVASTNCCLMMMHASGPRTPILLKVHFDWYLVAATHALSGTQCLKNEKILPTKASFISVKVT